MNFNQVDSNLSNTEKKIAEEKFNRLIVDLGLREDNYYCGSYMGGNNFQLLALMSMDHNLTSSKDTIEVNKDGISWGADYLINTNLRKIRRQLDKAFASIKEKHKYIALALNSLVTIKDGEYCSKSFKDAYKEQSAAFPKVMKALDEGEYVNVHLLDLPEQYIAACLLCIKLAEDLDAKDMESIGNIGTILNKFAPEVVLMSVRKFIGLSRLIGHDLDGHPIFGKLLTKISNLVN
jgi:hypothetical protein